jgi:hypothetical protein
MADGTSIPHITIKTPETKSGIDPGVAMLLGSGSGFGSSAGGMLGGGALGGGLIGLLIGAFLNGRNGGLFGGANGGYGSDAVAAASITTSKDVMAQLNTFQSWAANNSAQLAAGISGIDKSICCSSAQIIAAVNALTPQMYQGFAAQAMQSCQQTAAINSNITNGNFTLEKTLDAGFAAASLGQCRTDNLVQATGCDVKTSSLMSFNQLAQQLAACCCENRLAVANQNALIERNTAAISNQLNLQTCELKQATAASTAAILEKLNQQDADALRSQLADAKTALSNCQQTGTFSTILNAVENQQTAQIIAAINAKCNGKS